jgi:hypothetical protein
VTLGLCNEPGEDEQLTALFLCEARQVRAIRFDRSKDSYAGTQVVIGNVHAGIVLLEAHCLLLAAGGEGGQDARKSAFSRECTPP